MGLHGSQLVKADTLGKFLYIFREIMAFSKATMNFVRGLKTSAPKLSGHGSEAEMAKSAIMWKNLSHMIGAPICIVLLALAIKVELSHFKHPRREFVHYEYLAVRRKKFPWGNGNRTLFHNGYVNALPEGYEKEWFCKDGHH